MYFHFINYKTSEKAEEEIMAKIHFVDVNKFVQFSQLFEKISLNLVEIVKFWQSLLSLVKTPLQGVLHPKLFDEHKRLREYTWSQQFRLNQR